MAFPTDEELTALETQHKRIGVVYHQQDKNLWAVVLRKPNRAEYKRFRAWCNNPQRVADAQEQLFNDTIVWPAKADREAMLEDWPGIPEACAKMLVELAGMSGVEHQKS